MKLRYLGHSAFSMTDGAGRTTLVDPFLTGNPKAAAAAADFQRVDRVLVTHDHDDHLGDAFPICKRTGATLVAIFETAMRAQGEGVTVEPMSIGGSIRVEGATITMVNAQHGAGLGHAAGFVVESEGTTVYFAGDTALFGDMKLFGDLWDIDLAVLPIGDRFTMGPRHAAMAVEWLRPEHVVPCHYGTFGSIDVDPQELVRLVGGAAKVHPLVPGETLELSRPHEGRTT